VGKTEERERDILSIMTGQNDRMESKVVEPPFCSSCDVMQYGSTVVSELLSSPFCPPRDVTQHVDFF
jgi:hypothetical protein